MHPLCPGPQPPRLRWAGGRRAAKLEQTHVCISRSGVGGWPVSVVCGGAGVPGQVSPVVASPQAGCLQATWGAGRAGFSATAERPPCWAESRALGIGVHAPPMAQVRGPYPTGPWHRIPPSEEPSKTQGCSRTPLSFPGTTSRPGEEVLTPSGPVWTPLLSGLLSCLLGDSPAPPLCRAGAGGHPRRCQASLSPKLPAQWAGAGGR